MELDWKIYFLLRKQNIFKMPILKSIEITILKQVFNF
jgi:hypothetical protein